MAVNTNERELSGEIAKWLNESIRSYKVNDNVTNETGIKGIGMTTKFGDIVWWKGNREHQNAYALIELKSPQGANENLQTFREKAVSLNAEWALTWNFKELKIYSRNDGYKKVFSQESYPLLQSVSEWIQTTKQANLKSYLRKIVDSLLNSDEKQRGKIVQPDKVFFVELVNRIKDPLTAMYRDVLIERSKNKQDQTAIEKYAAEQGFVFPSKDEQYELLASHQVYSLLTKIIFYQTIRRFHAHLPDLRTENDDLNETIRNAFHQARHVDWQAVFEEGILDEFGIPQTAHTVLQNFLAELDVYRFDQMPQDVVGELFEEIIPAEERHRLGQYFTKEDLTDLVIAFAVNDPEACYADPTCGSGTFLNRLYSRLKYLNPQKSHPELLNHIWGFDVGHFPAQLATLNLFRQQIDNFENFPRVRCINSFDVKPGQSFDFPPPKMNKFQTGKESVTMPPFKALVGNFPFIRQELIEKKDTGFKFKLTRLIAREYFGKYNALFESKTKKGLDSIQEQLESVTNQSDQAKYLDNACKNGLIQLKLSGQADIYAYLYLHTANWLTTDGMFAMITSNSYLDVAYGSVLKTFFTDHFKIIAVIASWAEPWFEDAAVNTVITVLEKEPNPKKRAEHHTAFVKLLKPLKEIIPYSLQEYDSIKRWQAYDHLVSRVLNAASDKDKQTVADGIESLETPHFRLRLVKQELLQAELREQDDQSKWGKYLRAPDVYFEILEKCRHKLVPLKEVAEVRFGIKTGINDFFYVQAVENPSDSVPLGTVRITNAKGYEGFIEEEYLKRVIKSPKESDTIRINPDKLQNLLFVCPKTKEELRALRHLHALAYIEWGEKQYTKEGVKWTDVPSVSGRKNWYTLEDKEPYNYFTIGFIDKKFRVFENNLNIYASDVLFEWKIQNQFKEKCSIVINSSISYLFLEVIGRINLGDGVLKVIIPDLSHFLLPNVPVKIPNNILENILNREILPIFDEVKQKDRQALDKAVLEALGLDPARYQKRIYEGLCELVRERIELPKMRKTKQKQKIHTAMQDVKASVLKEVLPFGMPHFPDGFYEPTAEALEYRQLTFEEIESSGQPLHMENLFGTYFVKDEKGNEIYRTGEETQARFITLLPVRRTLHIPKDLNVIRQILNQFDLYTEDLRSRLITDAVRKMHNATQAEKLATEIMRELGLIHAEIGTKKQKKK
jgi:hypothetical protein